MSQSRFGGPAAPAFAVSKQELPYMEFDPSMGMAPPRAARRRVSTYEIGAGVGGAAAGVGMLNAARTYTPERARRIATEAAEQARGPVAAADEAAARVRRAAAADAARSTGQTRRAVRRATDNYRRTLPASSAAVNRAAATRSFAERATARRWKLAAGGVGALAGGAMLIRSGAQRRREGG